MEKFKAVEKEMKTKAYSKEGLSLAAKMDPKEREKAEIVSYLQDCVDKLEQQIEQLEMEQEGLAAVQKKGKKANPNAERISELERVMERHKWHQSKLELLQRTLENGGIDADEVKAMQEDISYYVDQNMDVDFMEDDTIYDHLNLQEEEEIFGMGAEADRVSSQDAQSVTDDIDTELKPSVSATGKSKAVDNVEKAGARRPSTQHIKSPLPALATLHAPVPAATNGVSTAGMKPAPPPAAGAPLKYASAAAAAAASDQNELGIAPLPPPAKAPPTSFSPATVPATVKATPPAASPAVSQIQPQPQRNGSSDSQPIAKTPAPSASPAVVSKEPVSTPSEPKPQPESKKTVESSPEEAAQPATPALTNGDTHSEPEEEESIFHLPSSLSDLLESFESTKHAAEAFSDPTSQRLFAAGWAQAPEAADAERPRHYRPQQLYPYTPSHFPQEPSPIFDDPRLYSRVDTDTLFYAFYYRQGTYQQYLSAKALKNQSWRFHKQYQTWFQRHEEPKSITEDYEQGTYRFFDYESTW
jgi:CCR4-NOT transcription complex subunit 3